MSGPPARDARWKREARIRDAERKLIEEVLAYEQRDVLPEKILRAVIAVRKARGEP